MDYRSVVGRSRWYLPTFLDRWRRGDSTASSVDELTRLVARNHPEAIVECEQVDISFLLSCMGDGGAQAESVATSDDLIDKFLSLSDFRIMAPTDDEVEVEQDWELVDVEPEVDPRDEFISEDLAKIYLKQGLYAEAKEIYTKLSLQYSEKSIYFANLKEQLEAKLSGSSENKLKK